VAVVTTGKNRCVPHFVYLGGCAQAQREISCHLPPDPAGCVFKADLFESGLAGTLKEDVE